MPAFVVASLDATDTAFVYAVPAIVPAYETALEYAVPAIVPAYETALVYALAEAVKRPVAVFPVSVDAFTLVTPDPSPTNVVTEIVAGKRPFASVPVEILVAFIVVTPAPFPDTLVAETADEFTTVEPTVIC